MNPLRRQFLDNLINVNESVGIEIGALDSPIVPDTSQKERIYYLDHLSTADLRKKYQNDDTVNKESIVSVNYVVPDNDIKKVVTKNKFDYVVASHVIEHIPNPIQWFEDVLQILKPGGFIYLVIPDKRFTFDLQRPITTFGQLYERYLQHIKIPPASAVYDHLRVRLISMQQKYGAE